MSDHHDDFAFEAMPGLPSLPPKGEVVLWQGRPSTWALAMQAYGLRWILGYFALLILWRASVGAGDAGLAGALAYGLPYVILAALCCGIVLAMAAVQARTTVYTITSSRVAMRIGAALTVTLNLPFAELESAGLDLRRSGSGTLALKMKSDMQVSYAVCWPHVRPWHMSPTQPALRCIPDAKAVAGILADAAETRVAQPVISRESFTAVAAE